MGTSKRELAESLGVTKQTVTNYIARLGLTNHVIREGNADVVDDFAASALATAIGTDKAPTTRERDDAPSGVVEAQASRITSLEAELERQRADYEARLSDARAELDAARRELADANDRLSDLARANADLSAEVIESSRRQQIIAATPWWRRWSVVTKLLGAGEAK